MIQSLTKEKMNINPSEVISKVLFHIKVVTTFAGHLQNSHQPIRDQVCSEQKAKKERKNNA